MDLLARALAAFYELRGEVDASVSDEEVARALRVALDRSQGDADALDAVTAKDVAACRDGARWGEGACCDGGDWPDDACHDGDAAPDGGWAILQDAPWGDDWRDGLAHGGLPSDTDEGEGRERRQCPAARRPGRGLRRRAPATAWRPGGGGRASSRRKWLSDPSKGASQVPEGRPRLPGWANAPSHRLSWLFVAAGARLPCGMRQIPLSFLTQTLY